MQKVNHVQPKMIILKMANIIKRDEGIIQTKNIGLATNFSLFLGFKAQE